MKMKQMLEQKTWFYFAGLSLETIIKVFNWNEKNVDITSPLEPTRISNNKSHLWNNKAYKLMKNLNAESQAYGPK